MLNYPFLFQIFNYFPNQFSNFSVQKNKLIINTVAGYFSLLHRQAAVISYIRSPLTIIYKHPSKDFLQTMNKQNKDLLLASFIKENLLQKSNNPCFGEDVIEAI